MTFEVLPGLPGTGPVPEQFSETASGTFREGFVVRFIPDVGMPWVGNFQSGIYGVSRALRHPDEQHVVVVSGGAAYVVDPGSRRAGAMFGGAIVEIYQVNDLHLLVFDHQGIRFEALGRTGIHWRTRRISWDGFRRVAIADNTLSGEAIDPMTDTWVGFTVDLRSGSAVGGSYDFPDATSWEKLYDAGQAS